jgi:hypothetical protein
VRTDWLKDILKKHIGERPGSIIALGHLCNLIEAIAQQRLLSNARKPERSKECDLEQLITYESIIALIEGLIDKENKEGVFDGIRRAAE